MILNPPAVRSDLLRAQLQLLLLAVERATPGPWDVRPGFVVGQRGAMPRYPSEFEDYGGSLVCESIQRSDAVVVAAARNLLPQLIHAHLETVAENENLTREVRWLRLSNDELRARQDGGLRADLERCREKLHALAEHAEEAYRLS